MALPAGEQWHLGDSCFTHLSTPSPFFSLTISHRKRNECILLNSALFMIKLSSTYESGFFIKRCHSISTISYGGNPPTKCQPWSGSIFQQVVSFTFNYINNKCPFWVDSAHSMWGTILPTGNSHGSNMIPLGIGLFPCSVFKCAWCS